MNTSILNVSEDSASETVRQLAEKFIQNRGRKCRVEFVKKDGSLRQMTIIPRQSWNEMNGKDTTAIGRKIVAAKVQKDIVSVVEFLGEGRFQPRSINLRTVRKFEVEA